ncbi:hypothetical protein LTS08_001308 [Lithohypha guttulata]|uniref:Uncharacterized protein n=1 Tax=Lithohypha guttulata TaxID=1690604 RepID=A0AAN7SUE1_9EURO|nr:hypothetical protein LTR51_007691 [Lithohypha guttulata]KAK5081730.1 hypothetical protein LTR05_007864 [Lithohypha guttulata]KAK5105035.1 hypothetical protein LTS08_001308 [Lithohypha guttulata]
MDNDRQARPVVQAANKARSVTSVGLGAQHLSDFFEENETGKRYRRCGDPPKEKPSEKPKPPKADDADDKPPKPPRGQEVRGWGMG